MANKPDERRSSTSRFAATTADYSFFNVTTEMK
jgi:hypothetical protein